MTEPRSLLAPDAAPAEPAVGPGVRTGHRVLAMTGYALVVAALFTVWFTGLIAFVLAWTHRKSPDPLARAHFRFQMWIADLAGIAVAVAATLAVWALILVGEPIWDGDWPTLGDFGGAAGLVVLGLVLWGVSFVGTIAGAAFGAWRLLRHRAPRERRSQLRPSRTAKPIRNPGVRARP